MLSKRSIINLPRKPYRQVAESDKIEFKEKLIEFYSSTSTPFITPEAKEIIGWVCCSKLSNSSIRKIMKTECNLSYVRCKSRPNNINIAKVELSRKLFIINFLQAIDKQTLAINIDEWVVSRNTKINYAWSKRGESKEYKNSSIQGSVSIIIVILSNGWWMVMLTNYSIDSEIFWYFIDNLRNWIEKSEWFGFQKAMITLDNWPCHRSKKTLQKLKTLRYKIMFLPAYSPSLAPIELIFGYFKMILKREWKSKIIKLAQKEWMQ